MSAVGALNSKCLSKTAKPLVMSTGSLLSGQGARYRFASIARKTSNTNNSAAVFAPKSGFD